MLSWEKDSTSGSATPFWTGKSILYGTIEKDLVDSKKIIVKLTLQPPEGPAAPSIAIAGSPEDISALVEDSARAILTQLRQPAASWNPVKEGERFAQSAEEAEKCSAVPIGAT